jgi:RNA polymerase-binding transcription factor DksA
MATAAARRSDLNLETFRRTLQAERDRLAQEIDNIHRQDASGGDAGETGELAHLDQHPADQGTELFFREQDQAIERGLRGELDQADAALRKMDEGTYGLCDRCEAKIPRERLEALPFALYCIDCAGQLEARAA